MQSERSHILDAAMKLPESERADLAAQLLDSLDQSEDDIAEVESAWRIEAERRLEEVEAGKRKTMSWPDVRRMIMGRANDASAA